MTKRVDEIIIKKIAEGLDEDIPWLESDLIEFVGRIYNNHLKQSLLELVLESLPKEIEICIVNGVEGKSICINGYRVAGSKPWGGGRIEHKWICSIKDILEAIPEVQEKLKEALK